MPILHNEVNFNESYTLMGFKDIETFKKAHNSRKRWVVTFGNRHDMISNCQKFRPKGNHQTDSVNVINIITSLAEKMNCRYDNIKYLILIRKS